MKRKTLGLIHTSATLVPMFQKLCQEKLPNVDTFNIVDDSLIKDTIAKGGLTPQTAGRVSDYVRSAAAAGADQILVTCSSIGAAVEGAAAMTAIPVLRVDRPMADQAVATGKRIGVIATVGTTMEPTADLIRRRAAAAGKEIVLTAKLCEGAFAALMSGDTETHDSKVRAALEELMQKNDVIVLAQASMARVVGTLPEASRIIPILASPPIAIDHLATILA